LPLRRRAHGSDLIGVLRFRAAGCTAPAVVLVLVVLALVVLAL